jgi:ABC-2 type transport system permease protein
MEQVFYIWYRDVIKFFRDRSRLAGSFMMPFMFLILFGSGMGGAIKSLMSGAQAPAEIAGFDFVKFMFPGIIGMTVFNTAIFSALSIVQDREFGFMKEIMVSPVPRVHIALGKTLGGATVALIQGLLMFVFVPFIGIKLNPGIVLRIIPAIFLVAFTISSIGILVASRLKSAQGFQMIVQLLVFPMLFLSGAYFPLTGMPGWMNVIVKLNPLTYAVDLFKKIILEYNQMPEVLRQAMGLNLRVGDHLVTMTNEVSFIALFGMVMIILAMWSFSTAEQ